MIYAYFVQIVADSLREDPSSVVLRPAQYNSLKEFAETELVRIFKNTCIHGLKVCVNELFVYLIFLLNKWLNLSPLKVIYGSIRIGSIDRIRMDTVDKAKYVVVVFYSSFCLILLGPFTDT